MTFDVIGGDDRMRNLKLHPVERPAVKDLSLLCDYPTYLQREARLLSVSSGRADLPEGASAVCHAESNKPLVGVHSPRSRRPGRPPRAQCRRPMPRSSSSTSVKSPAIAYC